LGLRGALEEPQAKMGCRGHLVRGVFSTDSSFDNNCAQVILDQVEAYLDDGSRPAPMNAIDPVTLEIFKNLFASVAEEMGVTLGRTAYSPNIKERLDFSCALFDGDGRLLAQAAHIPVHLGAMPASVRAAIDQCAPFSPGDVVVLNDPYLGGTHLPDITMVSPVFIEDELAFFVASRAHHADVGGMAPGSMPLATEIYQEGVIIPPLKIHQAGERNEAVWRLILRNVRTPTERRGDLTAQLAAHEVGARRVHEIVDRYGLGQSQRYGAALMAYAERLTRAAIRQMPDGVYTFADKMDDDGISDKPFPIRVTITIAGDEVACDFSGSAPAARGSINAVRAIVEAAVYYAVRCLVGDLRAAPASEATAEDSGTMTTMDPRTAAPNSFAPLVPTNAGTFAPITVTVPAGSLLDAHPPHAVAGGNVETSQRIVDVVLGALAQALPGRVPAASQGTMNNITFGGTAPGTGEPFAYYETLGGGTGGGPDGPGESGVHSHMSNTLNTPIEALEYALPIRVTRYNLRRHSGGAGRHRGGDGLRRDIQFLCPVQVTLLSERRRYAPYGLAGGEPGQRGRNVVKRVDGTEHDLPGKVSLELEAGETLSLRTPGGGGWGEPGA
jgi:N-methylhydantoinase B